MDLLKQRPRAGQRGLLLRSMQPAWIGALDAPVQAMRRKTQRADFRVEAWRDPEQLAIRPDVRRCLMRKEYLLRDEARTAELSQDVESDGEGRVVNQILADRARCVNRIAQLDGIAARHQVRKPAFAV